MAKYEGWTEIEPGFYLVDQSGVSSMEDDMRRQADAAYRRIKEATSNGIEFADGDGSYSDDEAQTP